MNTPTGRPPCCWSIICRTVNRSTSITGPRPSLVVLVAGVDCDGFSGVFSFCTAVGLFCGSAAGEDLLQPGKAMTATSRRMIGITIPLYSDTQKKQMEIVDAIDGHRLLKAV